MFEVKSTGHLYVIIASTQISTQWRSTSALEICQLTFVSLALLQENIINTVFYVVVFTVVLASLGLNPLAIFLSISGVVLGKTLFFMLWVAPI